MEPQKITFLDNEFQKAGERRILDLACGTGSYTIGLARLGYEAWGTDLEQGMIVLAKEKAATLDVAAHFAVGDMRTPGELGIQFDGLFCIGNSLAHLLDKDELFQALIAMRGVLKDGGVAIFQIVNFDRIFSLGDTDLPLIKRQNLCFRRTYRPQGAESLVFDSALEKTGDDGVTLRYKNSVELRPISRSQLEIMLEDAGFVEVRTYGDFKYGEHNRDSQAVVTVAIC